MDDIINLLDCVSRTMECISVVGVDNQDKFVGCAHAIQSARAALARLKADKPTPEAEEAKNG